MENFTMSNEHRKNNWRGRKAYARRNMTEKIGGKI